MIRTVWLGLAFLAILGGVGSFKFAYGPLDAANASDFVRSDGAGRVVTSKVQEAAVAQWRISYAFAELELAKASHAPAEVPRTPVAVAPLSRTPVAIAPSRIVSERCPPSAAPVIRHAANQKPKHKRANSTAIADKSDEAAEPKACQLADFDAVRAVLNLPTGCRT